MSSQMQYQPEWVREDFVDFVVEKINPVWAWKRVKATIVAKQWLSDDFLQITLRPNRNFKRQSFKAGQSVLCTLVIAGVRQQRSYSIVDVLANGDVVLAIRIQGLVSKKIAQSARGEVIEISQPQGEFILEPHFQLVVLIASGSGITAIYALLKQALASPVTSVTLLYFTRDDAFHVELEALNQQHAHFNYHHMNTNQTQQHLDQDLLDQLVPQLSQSMTYACGATAMMQSINRIFAERDLQSQLKQEFFQLPVDEHQASQPIIFARAQQQFESKTNLLNDAEFAGLRPTHGCRMGICNTCTCTKVSGSTKNILTGEIDHQSNTQIKLCISQAVSPVIINL